MGFWHPCTLPYDIQQQDPKPMLSQNVSPVSKRGIGAKERLLRLTGMYHVAKPKRLSRRKDAGSRGASGRKIRTMRACLRNALSLGAGREACGQAQLLLIYLVHSNPGTFEC